MRALLDVHRGVVAAPAVGVHPRGEEVRQDADRVRGRVDEAVEAGMGVAHREGEDVLAGEGEDLLEGRPSSGSGSSKSAARDPTLPKTGRDEQTLAVRRRPRPRPGVPRRRSSSGGRSKVGLSSAQYGPEGAGARPPLPLSYCTTPQPKRAPALPVGCVFRSSAFSWKMTDLADDGVRAPGLTVSRSDVDLEVSLAVGADLDVAEIAVVPGLVRGSRMRVARRR